MLVQKHVEELAQQDVKFDIRERMDQRSCQKVWRESDGLSQGQSKCLVNYGPQNMPLRSQQPTFLFHMES
jgi:hypothetical protein